MYENIFETKVGVSSSIDGRSLSNYGSASTPDRYFTTPRTEVVLADLGAMGVTEMPVGWKTFKDEAVERRHDLIDTGRSS